MADLVGVLWISLGTLVAVLLLAAVSGFGLAGHGSRRPRTKRRVTDRVLLPVLVSPRVDKGD